MPRLEQLRAAYEPRGFDFRIVYVREAHPGEHFPHHGSFEQKVRHARALRDHEAVRIRILVDDLAGTTHSAYGLRPNMLYLIDREGTTVYKSDWSDATELEGMCESLLHLEAMRAAGAPILRASRSERLHWIDMDPALRERVYRRSGEKAIRDFVAQRGVLPYATDAERASAEEVPGCALTEDDARRLLHEPAPADVQAERNR